ncbi:hypothetical protein ANCCAN_08832 [Ancylostoma caninum]|uniref:Uncharacterized protein n=1 Tax=Ancylostoma caninum TaxID=29170 RepID=A0A368GQ46_ANCCA|nr:hypothetical protein ANCCAN_08832 [Ancylostoma caninum]
MLSMAFALHAFTPFIRWEPTFCSVHPNLFTVDNMVIDLFDIFSVDVVCGIICDMAAFSSFLVVYLSIYTNN